MLKEEKTVSTSPHLSAYLSISFIYYLFPTFKTCVLFHVFIHLFILNVLFLERLFSIFWIIFPFLWAFRLLTVFWTKLRISILIHVPSCMSESVSLFSQLLDCSVECPCALWSVTQSCPALLCVQLFCDPMDCSLPGSSVHWVLQARILEWVAISSSRGSSPPRDGNCIWCLLHWQAGSHH